MAELENLWPEDIKVDVLSPEEILLYQASKIQDVTKGILKGEVTTARQEGTKFISHYLDIVAPLLGDYRHRILTVAHQANLAYPVGLQAPGVADDSASSENEFSELVRRVLRSSATRSVLDSLLARSNEARRRKKPA